MIFRVVFALILLLVTVLSTASAKLDKSDGKIILQDNMSIRIYQENKKGVPEFINGTLSGQAARGSEAGTAVEFFDSNRAAFKMSEPAAELMLHRIDEDKLGMRHLRFRQMYQGVKVFGAVLIAHFSQEGILRTVNGNYEADISLETNPAVSADQAVSLAVADLQDFFAPGTPRDVELVIFPWDGTHYLCWRMYILTEEKMGRWEYFINARDGSVIYKANRIMNDEEIGTGVSVMGQPRSHIDTWYDGAEYFMTDYTRQANNDIHDHAGEMPDGNIIQTYEADSWLPGEIAKGGDNIWNDVMSDGPAVDAHVYAAVMYDWLLHSFNRNSYDDAGATMISSVNYSAEGNNNGYWNGSQIAIWSWGAGWRSLAGCPDVIAHEWAHAVTEYTSGLIYEKESGALNESFSDMMGCAFEFIHDTLDPGDWIIAENGLITGTGFRNVSNPPQFFDPDTYEGLYWQDVISCVPANDNDWCGVHSNSGVGNKWFYLLSDGGTHNSITVSGIGVEDAIQIAYRANAFYWTPTTDYFNGALGTIVAAADIDPTLAYAAEVVSAWHAVNVPVPSPGLTFDYTGGLPHTTEPGNPAVFDVTVSGYLGATPIPETGRLHYSIDGAEYVETTMEILGENEYRATLPNVACGSSFSYYLSAEAEYVGTVTDPENIGEAYEPMIITETIYLLNDDFESDLGWTAGGTATAGDWERGIPAGTGSYGDPTVDFDGSGQCYLTGNAPGDANVDNGSVWLDSPAFDLTEGDAEIFYAIWFSNSAGSFPYEDVMTVQISENNGADWVTVKTFGPSENAEGGWNEFFFWAGDYVALTDQMKLRFEAEDAGNPSLVEAAVDAVSYRMYECPTFMCGDLDDEGTINILDIVYLINYIYKNGPAPDPIISADVDHDTNVNILDIVFLINFIYKNGPVPVCQ